MVWLVHEDFLWMNCVGCEGCAVCSESEADGLHGCHLSFDCIQGPTGLAMHLPYPVEIVAMYFFSTFTFIRHCRLYARDQIHNYR